MHTGELNRNIRRLNPQELSIQSRLGSESLQGAHSPVYVAGLEGRNAVVKPSSRHDPLQEVANTLYLLQGVQCVPKLYGVLSGQMRTAYGVLPSGAIVEEFATGNDLTDAYANNYYSHFQNVGYDPVREITSQGVTHFREGVRRGLLVRDFQNGNLLLDFNPDGTPKLTRIDYGIVSHATSERDFHRASESDYAIIIGDLISLAERADARKGYDLSSGSVDQRRNRESLERSSQRLRTNGETLLPNLMDSYAIGDFVSADPTTFSQFLDLLEKATVEHSGFVLRGALEQRQKRLEQNLGYMQGRGVPNDARSALECMSGNGYKVNPAGRTSLDFALLLADELGSVPPYLRDAVNANDDPFLKALMTRIDIKYAPKQPSQRKGSLLGFLRKGH